METLLVYAFCTASLFYLGSRAVITSWLWRHYPPKLAAFMDCSACSGTWYGALVAYVGGYHLGLGFMSLPGDQPATVAAVALCSMAFTPITAGLVQRGFDTLGTAVAPEAGLIQELIDMPANPTSREVSGTINGDITPRSPVMKVTIPPKEPDGSGPR